MTTGVRAYEKQKYAEAVVNYQSFIKLLEHIKGVSQGGLMPSQFDKTEEMSDLLMLVGVYWDLAKLFDQTNSPDRVKVFLHYLEKFILFSKGMSWQPMCAELLRRYILKDKPKHRSEFKNAYKMIGDGKCFIVTAVMEETAFETLPALWRFRDEVLMKNPAGRLFVKSYYFFGPPIAAIVSVSPRPVRQAIGKLVDAASEVVQPRHRP
jgi:hypothetical protein